MFASTIWRGVLQDTRTRSGLATMIAMALARKVATFSRWGTDQVPVLVIAAASAERSYGNRHTGGVIERRLSLDASRGICAQASERQEGATALHEGADAHRTAWQARRPEQRQLAILRDGCVARRSQ